MLQEATGYVMYVNQKRWNVRIQGSNASVCMCPPSLNELTSQHDMKTTASSSRFFVKEYSPIRIKILILGDLNTLNRVILKTHTLIIF